MLRRETFVLAINKIRQHTALMDKLHETLKDFGSFPPNLDFGSLHLEGLLAVLKDAMNDEHDYIGWWLYEAADYIVSWEENGKKVECDLKDVNALYDFLCGHPTVREV